MATLRCCSFNCRGWNSGSLFLSNVVDSFDLLLIQEHWLQHSHLYKINDISSDFCSTSVSGMDPYSLLIGRPFGGCSILYRKSLLSSISSVVTNSNRFCAVKIVDGGARSYLMVCVYTPSLIDSSSHLDYLNTIGELQGFIDVQEFDMLLVVGDFNVDFNRSSSLTSLLLDFMDDNNLVASDLSYQSEIKFTYERDDGSCHSWIDHVLCSRELSSVVTSVKTVRSGSTLSDHVPLSFLLHTNCIEVPVTNSSGSAQVSTPDWARASPQDIEQFQDYVLQLTPTFNSCVTDCLCVHCTDHCSYLDDYANCLVSSLLSSSSSCIPSRSSSHSQRLVGWKDGAHSLKEAANFWHKVWVEAGYPSSGVLFQIKKLCKRRYKYEVLRLIRKQQHLLRQKLARSFSSKKSRDFWATVRSVNGSKSNSNHVPVVDGVCGDDNIANLFASKLHSLLNMHGGTTTEALNNLGSFCDGRLEEVTVAVDDVLGALGSLKPGKTDFDRVSTYHVKYALPVIAEHVAQFFTAILRHGYMPKCFRDCVLVPIPKGGANLSSSDGYRPISIASCLSKVLERIILNQYSSILSSHHLQFGFKTGSSTSLCTGIVKCVVSRYLQNGSSVLGCFLDASKAFDMVNHDKLFSILEKRGLPYPIIRFLSSWYSSQQMRVRWGSTLSNGFNVSNGVRQGGILSPYLFSLYLDGLLEELADSGVGCFWGSLFVGAVAYADDVVLLAPCASALRCMLNICNTYASQHGLLFNAGKTQLICFRKPKSIKSLPVIHFQNTQLKYKDEVKHLGHILHYNLDDGPDITRAIKDLNKKANSVLCLFHSADPVVKTYLIKMYCLSLYGCPLWSLSSKSLNCLQIALCERLGVSTVSLI